MIERSAARSVQAFCCTTKTVARNVLRRHGASRCQEWYKNTCKFSQMFSLNSVNKTYLYLKGLLEPATSCTRDQVTGLELTAIHALVIYQIP